jgi:transposase
MQHDASRKDEGHQTEVLLVEPEVVRQILTLLSMKWGSKRIAAELGVARNTVRRYARAEQAPQGAKAATHTLRAGEAVAARVKALFEKEAAGNAVVVQRLLAEEGLSCSLRTTQRVLTPVRAALRRAQAATVRFETAPGKQLQIDFGQKWVTIGSKRTRVYVFVGVLGYSRRIFVRAFLSERQEDWQEGISEAFKHLGGCTRTLLIDNPKAMVLEHDTAARKVVLHPAFAGFCKDWGLEVHACKPARARTKGKVESGVKYVKYNALAGLSFTSFEALQSHLLRWMEHADSRVHGTTHQQPQQTFAAAEQAALQPLPARPAPARTRRLRRKVANDALVNVDTVRYSVPHRHIGETVEVMVGEAQVQIYAGQMRIANHARCSEPHSRVSDMRHYDGLLHASKAVSCDPAEAAPAGDGGDDSLTSMGRSLQDYALVVEGAS